MDILLITATAMEMRSVLSGLPDGAATSFRPEPKTDVLPGRRPGADTAALPVMLRTGSWRLHPLVCGVGPVNAAFALGRRLGLAEAPDKRPFFTAVLNMGIAGTYDPARLPVGGVAVASAEIWPEYGLADAGHVDAAGLGFAQASYRGERIVDRVELAPQEVLGSLGLGWHAPFLDCPAVTVAGCSAGPAQARSMQERTQGLIENMEGFALALGCLQYENGLGAPGVGGALSTGPSGAQTLPAPEGGQRYVLSKPTVKKGLRPIPRKDLPALDPAFGGPPPHVLPALPFVEVRSISNVVGCRHPERWDMPGALAGLSRAAKELFA